MRYDNRITGQIIGMLRVQRGMSQEVLSGLAGIARGHLGMIETGAKNANVETLWRISGALGIRLSELLRMVEDRLQDAGQQIKKLFPCATPLSSCMAFAVHEENICVIPPKTIWILQKNVYIAIIYVWILISL